MQDLFDLPLRRYAGDGVEIAYRTAGEGPPLLLLHGHPQSHAMWHKVWPALVRSRTLVAADLRGYGDSSKPPASPGHERTASAPWRRHGGADAQPGARALRRAGA